MNNILFKSPDHLFLFASIGLMCDRLQINEEDFFYAVKTARSSYRLIRLPKKGGDFREIYAPNDNLKLIQRLILNNFVSPVKLPSPVYGFGPNRTVVQNAEFHRKSSFVLNIDIQNFFPSINYYKINRLYIELGFSVEQAESLMRLTTLKKSLPQGAPTSPYLASLVLGNMDARLLSLCKKNRLLYSRYFDDVCISGGSRAHGVLPKVVQIIKSEGYLIHESGDKINLFRPDEEKIITGVTISKYGELVVPNFDVLKSFLIQLHRDGFGELEGDCLYKEKQIVQGKIAWASQIRPDKGEELKNLMSKIEWVI